MTGIAPVEAAQRAEVRGVTARGTAKTSGGGPSLRCHFGIAPSTAKVFRVAYFSPIFVAAF
jgi:hypothetical protein